MSDPVGPQSPDDLPSSDEPGADAAPEFTKEPQPELPLELRKQKAGLTRNRLGIWIVVGAFAIYLIVTGIVGILTKAR
jgi:hypothetical protein